jgi:hypothetical protein
VRDGGEEGAGVGWGEREGVHLEACWGEGAGLVDCAEEVEGFERRRD